MSRQAESCCLAQTEVDTEAETEADAPAAREGPAAGSWVALPDPEGSGDSYYWNQTTGETTWEVPPGFVADTDNTTTRAPARETESETQREETEAEAEVADSAHARSEPPRADSDSGSAAAPSGDSDDAPDEIKRALWSLPRAIHMG